jgi:tRNA threonylcarbamoyladenosine biosynthesis protein TsaE
MQKIFSEKEIPEIAEDVMEYIYSKANKKGATVVALSGDLGAGKTTLSQALGKKLGIKQKMASPTFILLKTYKIKNKNFKALHHIDAYRLEKPEHVEKLLWSSLVQDPTNLVFLEWPEMVGKLLPKNIVKIKLAHTKDGKRKIVLK